MPLFFVRGHDYLWNLNIGTTCLVISICFVFVLLVLLLNNFFPFSFLKIFLLGAGCNDVLSFNCFQCLTFVTQEKPHMFQFVPNEKQVTCSLQNVSYLTIKKSVYCDIYWFFILICFSYRLKKQTNFLRKSHLIIEREGLRVFLFLLLRT